jgi:hypothetical protein
MATKKKAAEEKAPSLEEAARAVIDAFRAPGGSSLEAQENSLDALEAALGD